MMTDEEIVEKGIFLSRTDSDPDGRRTSVDRQKGRLYPAYVRRGNRSVSRRTAHAPCPTASTG